MTDIRILLLSALLAVSLLACTKEEPAAHGMAAGKAVAEHTGVSAGKSFEEKMASGANLYGAHCAACHQANGAGLGGAFPPLAGSDYLADGPGPVIETILNGLSGPITVNGKEYNAVMPNLSYLDDSEAADIVTYVMNSWGNPGGEVKPAEVAAARAR